MAALERALLQVDDVVSARVLVDEPDRFELRPARLRADKAGVVVELLDQLEHACASLVRTFGSLLSTRETVLIETPAAFETS